MRLTRYTSWKWEREWCLDSCSPPRVRPTDSHSIWLAALGHNEIAVVLCTGRQQNLTTRFSLAVPGKSCSFAGRNVVVQGQGRRPRRSSARPLRFQFRKNRVRIVCRGLVIQRGFHWNPNCTVHRASVNSNPSFWEWFYGIKFRFLAVFPYDFLAVFPNVISFSKYSNSNKSI